MVSVAVSDRLELDDIDSVAGVVDVAFRSRLRRDSRGVKVDLPARFTLDFVHRGSTVVFNIINHYG
jgi:hypothetical protein